MGLGRGLASLIPKRNMASADDVLEQIDSMEEMDEVEMQQEQTVAEETIAMPKKPLVTPIFLEPEEEVVAEVQEEAPVKAEMPSMKVHVAEEEPEEDEEVAEEAVVTEMEEDEPVDDEEVAEEEMVQEAPQPVMAAAPTPAVVEDDVSETLASQALKYDGIWDRHEEQILHVPVGNITINPLQPRRTFDDNELKDLQESIAKNGILQPLVVRRLSADTYELIAGERRLRSAKALKWDKVPCVIRKDVQSDQSRLVFALIENIQRENLNPIEEALAYKQLNEDYGLTHEEIGERVGKSRVGVTNIVRVLQLPAEIQRGLVEGKITMGHAKAILMIPDPEKQIRFFHHLVDEGLTVRKAELRARRIQRTLTNGVSTPRNRYKDRHPAALKFTPMIEERFGYHTNIHYKEDKNAFEIVLKANNEAELNTLVGRLLGTQSLPPSDLDRDVIED